MVAINAIRHQTYSKSLCTGVGAVGTGGQGGRVPPYFDRSVNSISTREQIKPTILLLAPIQIFRPSYGPGCAKSAFLQPPFFMVGLDGLLDWKTFLQALPLHLKSSRVPKCKIHSIFFLQNFFQGHKPTHVFKTRIVGADWLKIDWAIICLIWVVWKDYWWNGSQN